MSRYGRRSYASPRERRRQKSLGLHLVPSSPLNLRGRTPKKKKRSCAASPEDADGRVARTKSSDGLLPSLWVASPPTKQRRWCQWCPREGPQFSGKLRGNFLGKQDEVTGLESAATETTRGPGGEKRSAERRDPVPEGRGGRDIKRVQRAGGQSAMKAARTQARSRASARTKAGARVAAGGLRLGRTLAEARRHPRIIPRAAGNPAGDPYGVSSHEAAIAG